MNKTVPICDVCDVFDGPHATPTKIDRGPIYLGIDAITDDGRLNPQEYNHLSEDDLPKWTKRVTPQKDDIVFSYEATLGRYAMIPEGFYGCLGRRLAIVRAKSEEINPYWLYYYFLSPEWKVFIANHTVKGSTVDRISVEDFPSYPIPKLDREKQNDIVDVLSAIDKRIDNNIQICDELEAMAKTLYDYWFVQFDFPDENGKPYCTSGGEMVWNDQLKREIPKGWGAGKLGTLCNFRNGINYDKEVEGNKEYRIINVRNISSSTLLLNENDLDHIVLPAEQADRYLLKSDDIIIARSGVPGATRLLRVIDEFTIFCGFIICMSPLNTENQLYLTYWLKRLEGTSATKTGGSILQNVSQDTLKDLIIAIPDIKIIHQFNEKLEPILDAIQNTIHENNELTKLRDWLLPMLMNGQATVADSTEKTVIPFSQPTETIEVRQAARNFGEKDLDDTKDLVEEFLRRKRNESKP